MLLGHTYLDCLAVLGIGGAHPGGLKLTKEILSGEAIDQSKSILEIGCGTGQTSAYIAEHYGCDVVALDNSNIMLDKAKQRFAAINSVIETIHGNVERLPFADHSFDFILSESVLSFTNIALSISECQRLLKQGGKLLMIEIVHEQPLSEKEEKKIKDFYGFSQLLSENEWVRLLRQGGFEQVSVEKPTIKFDEHDLKHATEFSPSENVSHEYFNILKEHEYLSNFYKDNLGYRIFRCSS
ncbi:class I SAM-dependent methyltransferase [Oceanobacillus sp. SE10311]|uniref:class I SAM-dependent methyltransferase n=1 Tax=Oceanobacillus sp. HCA-5259 TaxID=3134661 RepID=UPI0012EC69F4|nr:class I SAM-dependent methyltransferase [Oceanobacillus sp. AG]